MISRLEIRLKNNLLDAEGAGVKTKVKDYFGIEVDEIRVIRILTIDAGLTSEQVDAARTRIFTNPMTEESSFKPLARDFDWLIWVGYRPGVRDTAGSTAVEAIEDLFKIKFKPKEAVYTSKLYVLKGKVQETDVR